MRIYVLHLFCDGVLSETRAFRDGFGARRARAEALDEVVVGAIDGEVIDVNGSVWSASIEAVELR